MLLINHVVFFFATDKSCSLAPENVVLGNTKQEQLGSNRLAAPNTDPVAPVARMLDGPKPLFFSADASVCLQESHTQNQSEHWSLNCLLPLLLELSIVR